MASPPSTVPPVSRRWEVVVVGVVAGAVVVLREAGLTAKVPAWALVGSLAAAYLASTVAGEVWRDATDGPRLHARTAVHMFAATTGAYVAGWGPLAAIGYVGVLASMVRQWGSRVMHPGLFWALVGIAAGQAAIALDLVDTLVDEPEVHGVAVAAALGLAITVEYLRSITLEKEASQETADVLLELARSLAGAVTRQDVVRRLSQAIPRLAGGDRAVVLLREAPEARSTPHPGPDAEQLEQLDHLLAQGGPGAVTPEQAGDPELEQQLRRAGVLEAFIAPITVRGEVVATVIAERTAGGSAAAFSPKLVERLAGVVDQGATALEHARLLELEREAVARLRAIDKAKSDFLAVVSHELKTPLAVMLGAARTLQWRNNDLLPRMREELVESVVRRGEQLHRLVEDLLQASGDISLELAPVDLPAVVRSAVGDAAGLSPGSAISYQGVDTAVVVADGVRIRQVVDNLLANAAKHAAGTPVLVDVRADDRVASVTVADAGPGMTSTTRERAFEPFFQADSSAARRGGGLGLGLHICHRIVDAHGGRIWIEPSESGTSVQLTLPVAGPEA